MRTHKQIVGDIERAKQIASALRLHSVSTVRGWGARNSIPAAYWDALVSAKFATFDELMADVARRKPKARK